MTIQNMQSEDGKWFVKQQNLKMSSWMGFKKCMTNFIDKYLFPIVHVHERNIWWMLLTYGGPKLFFHFE